MKIRTQVAELRMKLPESILFLVDSFVSSRNVLAVEWQRRFRVKLFKQRKKLRVFEHPNRKGCYVSRWLCSTCLDPCSIILKFHRNSRNGSHRSLGLGRRELVVAHSCCFNSDHHLPNRINKN